MARVHAEVIALSCIIFKVDLGGIKQNLYFDIQVSILNLLSTSLFNIFLTQLIRWIPLEFTHPPHTFHFLCLIILVDNSSYTLIKK